MDALANWSWSLDGWIVAAGVLCAVAAALPGSFLVLRRMSLLGDAITHAVLPGLAVAFFVSNSRSSLPMFLGAVIVGVLTALFTEWIRKLGKVDEGASMGVVFTSLFALGLVMIVQAADNVHLDADCVLYGAIEMTPLDTMAVAGHDIPRAVVTLAIVLAVNTVFVLVFFKELKISSFDASLATTSGFHAGLMHYVLMILVAVTAVASFETVGSILVVAMFVVPPAAAYMLTDRLSHMIWLSVLLGAMSAVMGHVGALVVPAWFGYQSTTTAGMMAVAAGLLLFLAAAFGPRHGVIVRAVRRRLLSASILADDVVALLYRINERGIDPRHEGLTVSADDENHSGVGIQNGSAINTPRVRTTRQCLQDVLLADRYSLRLVLFWLTRQKQIERSGDVYQLTQPGQVHAQGLVRSHRLWEQYLTSYAGIEPERLHDKAERFEHFTDRKLRDELSTATDAPSLDPHGTPIPAERTEGA